MKLQYTWVGEFGLKLLIFEFLLYLSINKNKTKMFAESAIFNQQVLVPTKKMHCQNLAWFRVVPKCKRIFSSEFGIKQKTSFCLLGNGLYPVYPPLQLMKRVISSLPSLATLWQLGRPLTPEMINEQYSPNLIYHTSHADCRAQTKCSEPFLRILLKYVMISYKFYICVVQVQIYVGTTPKLLAPIEIS